MPKDGWMINTGWAHFAGQQRTGHYLDAGDPACGFRPNTLLGEMDLRADQPANACADCAQIVRKASGAPPHRHRWREVSSHNDGEQYVCRCGDHTSSP
jgi:hypothetical protein